MKLLFRLLTLYMAVPVIELFFLYQVNRLFGYWTGGYGWVLTGVLIIGTAVAGSYLAKREGLSAWSRLQGSLGEGGLPGDEILDAVIILIAGVLLITPGVLTDFVGFIGLVPLTRGWVRRLAKRKLKKAMREGRIQTSFGSFGGAATGFGGAPEGDQSGEAHPETDDPFVGGTPAERGPSPASDAPNGHSSERAGAGTAAPRALGEAAPEGSSKKETHPASEGDGVSFEKDG